MAYNPTNAVSVGLATKADHYNRVFENTVAIYAGAMGIASQAALDHLYAASATQLARLAKGAALQSVRLNAALTAYEWYTPTAGVHELFIPAPAMRPQPSSGCGALEDITSTRTISGLPFDATSAEVAYVWLTLPKSWNLSTVTFQPYWMNKAGGSGNVVWSLAIAALADDDPLSTAYGTAATVTDAVLAAYDVAIGAESAAITIANTPAVGDILDFVLQRLPADAGD